MRIGFTNGFFLVAMITSLAFLNTDALAGKKNYTLRNALMTAFALGSMGSGAEARVSYDKSYVDCKVVTCAGNDGYGNVVPYNCGTPGAWALCTQWGLDGPSGAKAMQCTNVNWGIVVGNVGPACLQAYTPDDDVTRNCQVLASYGRNDVWCSVFSGTYGETCSTTAKVGNESDETCYTYYAPKVYHYVYDSCFTKDNWFRVKNDDGTFSMTTSADIRVGMNILSHYETDGSEVFSPVTRYPHYDSKRVSSLPVLSADTEIGTLRLTADHLVPIVDNGEIEFKFMKELKIGDLIKSRGRTVKVTSEVIHYPTDAAFAFHTASGTAVTFDSSAGIEGLEVSVFSTYKSPSIQEALFRVRDTVSYLLGADESGGAKTGSRPYEVVALEALQFISPWGFPEPGLRSDIKAGTPPISGARALLEQMTAPAPEVNTSSGFDPRGNLTGSTRNLRGRASSTIEGAEKMTASAPEAE